MSQEISRMYASTEHAQNAAAELAEEGFKDVFIVAPPASGVPVSTLAAQIALGRVILSDAKIYAVGVAKGGTLLTVHAPFGSGKKITNILSDHNPIPSGLTEAEPEQIWNEATPFSSALHMPLLLADPAPVSRVMGISPLAGSACSFSAVLGLPLLSDANPMPEGRWGLSFLINNPAPLSSLLGLPILAQSASKG